MTDTKKTRALDFLDGEVEERGQNAAPESAAVEKESAPRVVKASEVPGMTTKDEARGSGLAPVTAPRPEWLETELAKEEESRFEYFLGVTQDSPFANITVGGITFQQRLGALEHDTEGNPFFRSPRGAVVWLSRSQVAQIVDKLSGKVVRFAGHRPMLMARDGFNYRPAPGDRPLGEFIYLVQLDRANLRHDWRDQDPPTIVPRKAPAEASA